MFEFPHDFIIYINGVLILLLLFAIYRGYKRGLILQVIGLVSTIVSLIIAWIFSDVFATMFPLVSYKASGLLSIDTFITNYANRLIWVLLLFVIIRLLLLVLTPIATVISKIPLVKQVNSLVGAVFGLVNFVVYLLLITFFLTLPIVKNGQDIINNTFLKPINESLVPVISIVDKEFNDNEIIQSLISNKGLTTEQKRVMVKFLHENGFTSDEIQGFINSYE